MSKHGAEIVFVRTLKGQFFYDLVMSEKTEKWLARKWQISVGEVRKLRSMGREIMDTERKRAR